MARHSRAGRTAPESGGEHVHSQGELAEALGVHPRTIRKMVAQGGPARTPHGYAIAAWREWHTTRRPPVGLAAELTRARITLTKLKSELEQVKVARARGELMTCEHALELRKALCRRFVNTLERCAPELTALLAGAGPQSIRKIIEDWIYARRVELAAEARAITQQDLSTKNKAGKP